VGFYNEDRFVSVKKTLEMAEAAWAQAAGRPAPAGMPANPFVVDPYFWLKEYQSQRWVDVSAR
jgi:hypothetical protein